MIDEYIYEILRIADEYDCRDYLAWNTEPGEYRSVTFYVICNDVFCWGSADAEVLTRDNVHEWRKALEDATAIDRIDGEIYGTALFVARQRKTRPQGASYPNNTALWPLFDACGPERETGFGNPYKPGEYACE